MECDDLPPLSSTPKARQQNDLGEACLAVSDLYVVILSAAKDLSCVPLRLPGNSCLLRFSSAFLFVLGAKPFDLLNRMPTTHAAKPKFAFSPEPL
jgi:hypothetical protein